MAAALSLAGKHCAIVGATGTIGSHIAQTFSQHGAKLTLLGRSALQARSRIEGRLTPYTAPDGGDGSNGSSVGGAVPGAHRFVRLDVSERESIKRVFSSKQAQQDGEEIVGPVDILVNCSGISQTTLLKRTPDEELARIMDTNLLAAMLTCKYARMQPNGSIINISSLMGLKGGLGVTAYAASKAGMIGFTRALCREMSARSIRVNALLPGWVESPMWDALKPDLKQAYLKDIPAGRVASPEEVADAALFLATNSYANNCVLNLDGGLSAA